MVSKKKLNNGFNGYHAANIPKAPRSIRKKGPHKDSIKESGLCAFDLLAAVAGKLLQESESSASSNGTVQRDIFRNENYDVKATTKSECFDRGSCAESAFVPDFSTLEHTKTENNATYAVSSSEDVRKVDCDIKLETVEVKKVDEKNRSANTLTVKDGTKEFVNTNTVINLEDSVHLPLYSDPMPVQKKHLNNVDLGTRDDDENSSGCDKSSTKIMSVGPQPCIGNSRIRKMLMYKHRKSERYYTCDGMKSFYEYRKRNYMLGRCQQGYIRKRKLFDHSSTIVCDQDTSSDSISNFPEKGTGNGLSSPVRETKDIKDHRVKFSIKSFRVPELCIEVPENASIRSLKRAVMETVTSIIGSGFQVGVVLQGKKVQDDNETLQEAGISDCTNLDTLGFMLEPSCTDISSPVVAKNPPPLLPQDSDHNLLRSPSTPMIDSGILGTQINLPPVSRFDCNVENNGFKSSPEASTNERTEGVVSDSKAIVAVPPMNSETLAVVPVSKKPKRDEHSQRRTRRPFSVVEVESLVEAVETLGTGRWRDVKMRAFEHVDHRTYVDLKDKWKTLVHTASIAPQQRRGEAVPQELLDRVLAAHSYWSQHQSKQLVVKSTNLFPQTVQA